MLFACQPPPRAAAMFTVVDSVASVTVCLAKHRVASYHAVLTWDTAAATLVRAERSPGGLRVENTDVPGRLDFAGIDPAGFAEGPVLTVQLRPRGSWPAVRLTILELNGRLIAKRQRTPRIESIAPDTMALGSTASVTIRGRYFARDSNWVEFGPTRVGPRASENGVIRFVVPAVLPATGEAPPLRLGPATYPVRVTTRTGSSNVVPFTLVERAP